MKQLPNCSDYMTSIETPQLIRAERLKGGHVECKNGKPLRYAGGFCIVFPYYLKTGKKVAVRCWTANICQVEKRSIQISSVLQQCKLPYFVGFEYIKEGLATQSGILPIIIMDWVDAKPLKYYLKDHIKDSERLTKLAEEFKNMVIKLHEIGISHGDLQHGNIMVSQTGAIYLVDYDSMFVPGLEGESDEIKGLVGYQHPCRFKNRNLSPKADYFSELIIYTSIVALSKYPSLWTDLEIENTETLVFSQADLDKPESSKTIHRLKSDSELSNFIEAIERALNINDIEALLPLEDAIIPESKRIIENLKEKWNQQKKAPQNEPEIELKKYKEKWNRPRPQNYEPDEIDINTIVNKWRK